MGFLSSIFCSENTRNVRKLEKIALKIEELDEEFSKKSDLQLMKMTKTLKDRLQNGETLNDILPEAYATVREASFSTLNFWVVLLCTKVELPK